MVVVKRLIVLNSKRCEQVLRFRKHRERPSSLKDGDLTTCSSIQSTYTTLIYIIQHVHYRSYVSILILASMNEHVMNIPVHALIALMLVASICTIADRCTIQVNPTLHIKLHVMMVQVVTSMGLIN